MIPCPNCCGDDPCTIGVDTFDTDLSQFATTGSPSVSAGSLLMSSGDRVIFTPEPATDDDGVRVQTFPLTEDATATMRLIAAWTDANNYLFGELSIAASAGTIRLGQVRGGSSAWLTDEVTLDDEDAELNDRSTLTLCWQPGITVEPASGTFGGFAGLGSGISWASPNGVIDPGGSFAEFSAASTVTTETLTANHFGFIIPPGSTIDGIAVNLRIEHDGMDTDYVDSLVKLVNRTGTDVGDNKATGLSLNSFETNVGWGGDTDDWNAGLTWEDIESPNFGVLFQFTNNGNAGNIRVRGAEITIWYTTSARRQGTLRIAYTNTSAPNAVQCATAFHVFTDDGLKTGISVSAGDWDYTTYDLQYLQSGSRPTCLNCGCSIGNVLCNACCDPLFPPAETYVVDLGAGGWTDTACGHCDEVLGEYALDAGGPGACVWLYDEPMNCTVSGDHIFRFEMRLWLISTDDGCIWRLGIGYTQTTFGGATATGAFFESDPLASDEDCNTLPVTLTKTFEYGGNICGGAMPATVTLEVAT